MPTAVTGAPAAWITERAAPSISSRIPAGSRTVGRSWLSTTAVPEIAPAAIFVPPTSTPTLSSVISLTINPGRLPSPEHTSPGMLVSVPISSDLLQRARMDRRLANRNIRTALIAGAISLIIFALAFVAAYLY